MRLHLDTGSLDDYQTFLKIKSLPQYRIIGHIAEFPDEYLDRVNMTPVPLAVADYTPHPEAFDYQADIVRMALVKRKFCIFADCGLGKTIMFLDYAKHVLQVLPDSKCVLIVSPLNVIEQTMEEAAHWFGEALPIEQVKVSKIQDWLNGDRSCRLGITNYEAMKDDLTKGDLGGLIPDESSSLKSAYGKHGQTVIRLGAGLEWKLACTGTPAPNDRIEYANHAVFMDAYPTVNAFLARFFVNRGQTQERWVIRPHGVEPFYRALSHWCIFLNNPATYGWKDLDTSSIPPIHIHRHHVELTPEQTKLVSDMTGALFAYKIGGIANRASLGSIAKGWYKGKPVRTNKPTFIRNLVESWPEESTLIWCLYNKEQELLEKEFPQAASLKGDTPHAQRRTVINDFKAGRIKVLISKPQILGFGLNLQAATRQVFSGLADSYEKFYQAVKRSNRIGSTRPLNVHIPMTDIEEPMVENVMRKARMIQKDSAEQERIFRRVK